MKVLALDPGGTTGFAEGIINDNGLMTIRTGQTKLAHYELFAQLTLVAPDKIIYETFKYRNRARKGLELISAELIGVIQLYSHQYSVEVFAQDPGEVMGHFTDKKLKQDGLYKKAHPHAMDALRHLLHWYTFKEGYQYNIQGFKNAEGR